MPHREQKEQPEGEMSLARQAHREGRYEQMWWLLLQLAQGARVDLCLEALRFIEGVTPFSLKDSLPIFDLLSRHPQGEVRERLLAAMEKIAQREPRMRTPVLERLVTYSRRWDSERSSSETAMAVSEGGAPAVSPAKKVAAVWPTLTMWEKILLRQAAELPETFCLADALESVSAFRPLLPDIEVMLKLESFAERALLASKGERTYSFGAAEARGAVKKYGDLWSLLRENRADWVRCVTLENFDAVRERLRKSREVPLTAFLQNFGIGPTDWKHRERLAQYLAEYRSALAQGEAGRDLAGVTNQLVADMAHRLGVEIQEQGVAGAFAYAHGLKLGVRNPKLRRLALLLARRRGLTVEDLGELERWVLQREVPQRLYALVCLDPEEAFRAACRNSALALVAFGEPEMMALAFAESEPAEFMRRVLSGCDLESLSPYETQAPVREMFYGRDSLVHEILRSEKGYAIVATRRMGKTSLLYRVQDELRKNPKTTTLFLECGGVTDPLVICERLNIGLHLGNDPVTGLDDFELRLRKHLSQTNRHLALLFDEVDDLLVAMRASPPKSARASDARLARDRRTSLDRRPAAGTAAPEAFWQIFKSLAFEGRLRVFMAGFSELFARYRDYESLFFNFLIFRQLGALDRPSAEALIVEPLEELGLGFEDRDLLVGRILEVAGTHPNQIQIFCDLLVRRLASLKHTTILAADVDEISRHSEFEESIIRIMDSNLVYPLEKSILCLLAFYDILPITALQVVDLLADWDIQSPVDRVTALLDKMTLYSVLECREGRYTFAHPFFPTILRKRDVESMIIHYAEEVLANRAGPR